MAELKRDGNELVVNLTTLEKAEAAHGAIRVPVSSIRAVDVLEDAIHAVHGLRAPGTGVPGFVAVGTFYGGARSGKTFAVVHHTTPRGVRIRFEDAAYDELILGCEDPEAVKDQLVGETREST